MTPRARTTMTNPSSRPIVPTTSLTSSHEDDNYEEALDKVHPMPSFGCVESYWAVNSGFKGGDGAYEDLQAKYGFNNYAAASKPTNEGTEDLQQQPKKKQERFSLPSIITIAKRKGFFKSSCNKSVNVKDLAHASAESACTILSAITLPDELNCRKETSYFRFSANTATSNCTPPRQPRLRKDRPLVAPVPQHQEKSSDALPRAPVRQNSFQTLTSSSSFNDNTSVGTQKSKKAFGKKLGKAMKKVVHRNRTPPQETQDKPKRKSKGDTAPSVPLRFHNSSLSLSTQSNTS